MKKGRVWLSVTPFVELLISFCTKHSIAAEKFKANE